MSELEKMAAVYAPMTREMFVARKGGGAFLNGKRIHVSEQTDLGKSLLVYCNGNSEEDLARIVRIFAQLKPKARDFNRMRAGALELAFVAAGRLEAYVASGLSPWDVAAGSLLVTEAGGRVTDFHGERWNLTKNEMIASNGKVHEKIISELERI